MDYRGVPKLRRKPIRIDLALFFLIFMNQGWFGADANGEKFVGRAVNTEAVLEYVEHYTVKYKNGKVTER